MKFINVLIMSCTLFFNNVAGAQEALIVPKELDSWVEFVKQKTPNYDCSISTLSEHNPENSMLLLPQSGNKYCIFAGVINLETKLDKKLKDNSRELSFNFTVKNDSNSREFLSLPYSNGSWPKSVKKDGKEVEVFIENKNGKIVPIIELGSRSQSQISFELNVPSSDSTLNIPEEFGYINRTVLVDGVPQSTISQTGQSFLELRSSEAKFEPSTSEIENKSGQKKGQLLVEVYRFIEDAPVLKLKTVLRLQNSSSYSNVGISGLLLEKELPISVGQIPRDARSKFKMSNKAISLTVPPGISLWEWDSVLGNDSVSNLKTKPVGEDIVFASNETWFLKSNSTFRNLKVSGAPVDISSISKDVVDLIVSGRVGYQVYQGVIGKGLDVSVVKGKSVAEVQEQLKHESKLWVSFDGDSVTYVQNVFAKKKLPGQWFVEDWNLQQIKINDEAGLLFEDGGKSFFGYPNGSFSTKLVAKKDFSIFNGLDLPVALMSGEQITNGSWILNLPAGWRALAVMGSGSASEYNSGFWLNKFNLWDWFLLILIVWSGAGVLGIKFAPLLLFALLVGRLHYHAPFEIFLPIILLIAIIKRLPVGMFKNVSIGFFVILSLFLGLNLISYSVERIQKTIHVSMDEKRVGFRQENLIKDAEIRGINGFGGAQQDSAEMAMSAPPLAPAVRALPSKQSSGNVARKSIIVKENSNSAQTIAPQAGIGEPTWEWFSVVINQNGSAKSSDKIKVWLLPAGLQRVLTILGIVFFWIVFIGIIFQAKKVCIVQRQDGEVKNV